jgi:hypothetical protein
VALVDKIKQVFSRPTGASVDNALLKELETASTIEPYVMSLRAEWLNDRATGDTARQLLAAARRFSQHEALVRILGAIYEGNKVCLNDPPLLEYAASLTRTTNFAFEGYLYRARVLIDTGRSRQAISSAIRAVTSSRLENDLVRWYLRQLLRECTSSLYTMAEKDLSADDGATALMLAYVTVKACSDLMAAEWKSRVAVLRPSCSEQIEKEVAWTVSAREQLLELAQQYSLKSSLNPGFIARSRVVAGLPLGSDAIAEFGAAVVRERTRETTQEGFYKLETKAHQKRMIPLAERLTRLRTEYDGCVGLIELDAEEAERTGKPVEAAQRFKDLVRRRPHQTYYAYRAAQLLDASGDAKESRAYWIHASRTIGSGWRSKLASIVALTHTCEFETARLRTAPVSAVPQTASAVAAFLEERMNECWNSYYWPAAFALGSKAAQLYHLAAATTRDSATRQAALDKAKELYATSDDTDGLKSLDGGATEAVYERITIPLVAYPV